MTPQEAIKYIEQHNHIADDVKDMCINALEKQIPKKVTYPEPVEVKAFDNVDKIVTFKCYPCPECGKWIVANTNNKYCEHCGQALKWE